MIYVLRTLSLKQNLNDGELATAPIVGPLNRNSREQPLLYIRGVEPTVTD